MAKRQLTPIETLDNHPQIVKSGLVAFEKKKKEFSMLAEKAKTFVINGIDDVEGYAAADEFRKKLKKERAAVTSEAKEWRDPFTAITKHIISKENELVGIVSPAEKELEAKLLKIDNEKAAIENEKQEKFLAAVSERKGKLVNAGFSFDGETYHIQFENEPAEALSIMDIETYSEEDFQDVLKSGIEIGQKIAEAKKAKEAKELADKAKADADAERVKQLEKQLRDTFKESAKSGLRLLGYLDELDGMKHSVHGDLIYANRFELESQEAALKLISEKTDLVKENNIAVELAQKEAENSKLNTDRVEKVKELGLGEYFTMEELSELFVFSESEFEKIIEVAKGEADENKRLDLERAERLSTDKSLLVDYIERLKAVGFSEDDLKNDESKAFYQDLKGKLDNIFTLAIENKIANY